MSQEIIYTSSPEGLRPGSFGFCTVATTPGMATSLAERLESLSGYRHVHPPGHPSNPVVYSHLVLKVGGQRLNVLSRIADVGLDYSQRTNKLAHHVALSASELSSAGPAWVLSQPSFAETAWTGKPRILPTGRKPPVGNLTPQTCKAWEQMTGDAGWGGILAQHALDARRPAYIIFPENTDVLALLVEAQSLLPPARRWEVSFSTYFTRLPAGVDCQWRCVLAGSPEAAATAALRGEMVLDLTHPLGTAADGPLVEIARTGRSPIRDVSADKPRPPVTSMLVVDESEQIPEQQTDDQPAKAEEIRLRPPPLAVPSRTDRKRIRSQNREDSYGGSTRAGRGLFLAAMIAALVLFAISASVAVVWIERGRKTTEIARGVEASDARPAQPKTLAVDGGSKLQESQMDDAKAAASEEPTPGNKNIGKDETPPSPPEARHHDAGEAATTARPTTEEPTPDSSLLKVDHQPPAIGPQRFPEIGKYAKESLVVPPAKQKPSTLISVPGEKLPEALAVALLGGEGRKGPIELIPGENKTAWTIWAKKAGPVERKQIATISAGDDSDAFSLVLDWKHDGFNQYKPAYHRLKSCALSITLGENDKRTLILAEPVKREKIVLEKLSFSESVQKSISLEGIDEEEIEIKVDSVVIKGLTDEIAWKPHATRQPQVQFYCPAIDLLALETVFDTKLLTLSGNFTQRVAPWHMNDYAINASVLDKAKQEIVLIEEKKQRYDEAKTRFEAEKQKLDKLTGKENTDEYEKVLERKNAAKLDKDNREAEFNFQKNKSYPPIQNDQHLRLALLKLHQAMSEKHPPVAKIRIVRVFSSPPGEVEVPLVQFDGGNDR